MAAVKPTMFDSTLLGGRTVGLVADPLLFSSLILVITTLACDFECISYKNRSMKCLTAGINFFITGDKVTLEVDLTTCVYPTLPWFALIRAHRDEVYPKRKH